jgi:glycosyltransferase involved in cell wall biosynthesis
MIQNPRYLSLLIERKLHDRSFLPLVCLQKVLIYLLRFFFKRYIMRKPIRSFKTLLSIQSVLMKLPYYSGPVSRLRWFVSTAIRREIFKEGPETFRLNEVEKLSERDIQYIKSKGGIILKIPRFVGKRVMEKGALLLTHSIGFQFFCYYTDVPSVLEHYTLILEPGWSGYTDPAILYFTRFKEQPIIVMATEKRDYEFLKALGTNLIPVSFGFSDWVNPLIFRRLDHQEKKYDAVYVGSWLKFKRHHILFRALYELKDPSFKVALVSRSPDNREEIELLIDAYSVRDNVTLFEQISPEDVNKILNQSKVNLLLSLQEGSNRALFEGFFAGVPGLALKNNIGIPKDYFNSQTGKLIKEKDLKSQLLYFRENWNEFNPRPWAETNITPEITISKLNEHLKYLAYQRREEWTRDLVAKCNAPDLEYYPNEIVGRGLPTFDDILVRYARINKDNG